MDQQQQQQTPQQPPQQQKKKKGQLTIEQLKVKARQYKEQGDHLTTIRQKLGLKHNAEVKALLK